MGYCWTNTFATGMTMGAPGDILERVGEGELVSWAPQVWLPDEGQRTCSFSTCHLHCQAPVPWDILVLVQHFKICLEVKQKGWFFPSPQTLCNHSRSGAFCCGFSRQATSWNTTPPFFLLPCLSETWCCSNGHPDLQLGNSETADGLLILASRDHASPLVVMSSGSLLRPVTVPGDGFQARGR